MFLFHKKHRKFGSLFCHSMILGLLVPVVQAQGTLQQDSEPTRVMTAVKPVQQSAVQGTKSLMSTNQTNPGLPLWTYFTESSRDFGGYSGVMVGRDPFNGGGSVSVPANIVPLIIVTNAIATGVGSDGKYTTKPGVTKFDPTSSDNACLTAPNNVPLSLFRQSPLFENADFNFGGTDVGKTQYVDAFQRGEFWQVLGNEVSEYHLFLHPVKSLTPIVINVPAAHGLARPTMLTGGRTICGPQARVDIDWFDNYLNTVVIPALGAQGVAPANLPVFLVYNTVWGTPAVDPRQCCILGYHSGTNTIPIQTYSVADFDETRYFPLAFQDTATLSHEIAEWANDPFVNNLTPPWGNTGQVIGACQNNLEVGDPLSNTEAPRIAMPNGFTYHLQELAFFSWFYGSPSVGIHSWYSNNGSFLTDAGPPCQPPASSSGSSPTWIIR
jgi:hypothetical protein